MAPRAANRGSSVAAVLGLLVSMTPALFASAAHATVVNFDDKAAGTILGEQYAAKGVHLGPSPFSGQSGRFTARSRPGQAHSKPNVAELSYDAGNDFSSSWIKFDSQQRKVSFHACRTGTGGNPRPNVNVVAYDSNGNVVDNQGGIQCDLNGPMTQVTVEKNHVSYLNVYAVGSGWNLDDLNFETSPPPQPPPPKPPGPKPPGPPDFSIGFLEGPLTPKVLTVVPGRTAKRQIVVGRNEKSSGRVRLSAEDLPPGVQASFSPTVSDSNRAEIVTMVLSAAHSAQPGLTRVTVRGSPLDPSAGSKAHTASVDVLVQGQLAVSVEGIELNQAVQTVGQPGKTTYDGVALESGRETVARVFADFVGVEPPAAPDLPSRPAIGMALYGTDDHGRPLPGSPLDPMWSPDPSGLALNDSGLTSEERRSAASGFVYVLPDSWTRAGPISLTARALAPEPSQPGLYDRPEPLAATVCVDKSCGAKPERALGGVTFMAPPTTRSLNALRIVTDVYAPAYVGTRTPLDAERTFAKFLRITPVPYVFRSLDGSTSPIPRYQADTRARSDALWEQANMYDALIGRPGDNTFGVFDYAPGAGVTFRTSGGLRVSVGTSDPASGGNPTRPITVIAHEIFHTFGLKHADSACGGADGAFADPQGRLGSVGLDTTPGSGGMGTGAPPFRTISDTDAGPAYDLMSYCGGYGGGDPSHWVSALNWNRVLGQPDTQRRTANRVTGSAAAPHTIRVHANAAGGRVRILSIGRAEGPPSGTSTGSPYTLVARGAGGKVLASVTMRAARSSGAAGAPASTELEGDVPAANVSRVEIFGGGKVLASRRRSAAAPSVRLLAPRRGARVGSGRAVTLRWKTKDPDGVRGVTVRVEYSFDGGRTFHPVASGRAASTTKIDSVLLPPSRHARLRAVANDGFNEAATTSAPFTVVPRRPHVTILDPGRGVRIQSGATLYMRGGAVDAAGRALPGSRLIWRAGKHVLGHGNTISAVLPSSARAISLEATDAGGRKGVATIRLKQRRIAPFFLRLRAPRKVPARAHALRLGVATTVDAVLRIGSQRFHVGRRAHTIKVHVRSGKSRLTLRLRLRAGGKTRTQYLVVRRG